MRKKYRYQFYEVSQDSTLVLENPSYIKFINIGLEGYSSNNVPPIPLQVIGFSNYIL